MKMIMTQVSPELEMFEKVRTLPPDVMNNLVSTVCAAASSSNNLSNNQEIQQATALIMLVHAYSMIEACGCTISAKISSEKWEKSATYETGEV